MNFIIPPPNYAGPDDEPLDRPKRKGEFMGISWSSYKRVMTFTGHFCVTAPWLFYYRKKLECTLYELGLFLLATGYCAGLALGVAHALKLDTFPTFISTYSVVHTFSAIFCIMIYQERMEPGAFFTLLFPRYVRMTLIYALCVGLLHLVSHFMVGI